jgi:hypothetical protein
MNRYFYTTLIELKIRMMQGFNFSNRNCSQFGFAQYSAENYI